MSERAITVRIIGDPASLERAFAKSAASAKTFEAQMASVGKRAEAVGGSLTRHLTLPIVAAAAASAKMAIDFQRQMTMIQTQAGASAGEVKKMSSAVLELAKHSAEGPQVLAQGLYHLESLGLRGSKALNALRISSNAAGMGMADMEQVTTALGGAVVTGIKGTENYTHAMGVLNATIGAGNMKMDDLTAALGTGVLPMAKAVGLHLNEVGAALATLTDRGMKADEAATRLKMTFALMEKPTTAASKGLADMGISSRQLADLMRQGNGQGLLHALELLQQGMANVGDKTKATQDLLKAFGGGRSGAAILTLVQSLSDGLSSYGGKLAQVNATTGKFAQNVIAYHQTASYKISSAWSSIQADMIKAGGSLAPVAASLAHDVAAIANAFSNLSPNEKKVITDMAGLLAVLGPTVLVGGKLIKTFLALRAAMIAVGGLGTARELAGVGAAAAGAETKAASLRLALMGLRNIGVIGISIVITEQIIQALSYNAGTVVGNASGHQSIGSTGGGKIIRNKGHYYQMVSAGRGGTAMIQLTSAQAQATMAGGSPHGGVGQATQDSPRRGAPAAMQRAAAADAAQAAASANAAARARAAAQLAALTHSLGPAGGGGGGSGHKKKPAWKGATEAAIVTAHGAVAATLKGLPTILDPVEEGAIAHIKELNAKLHIHMSAADLAKDKVELAKWGKVLRDEIHKNAAIAAAAAAEEKKQFDRALALDVSHVLRDFDRQFSTQMKTFDTETSRHLKDMQTSFARQQLAFDRETQRGLQGFVVKQTPEEKALKDFQDARAAELAKQRMEGLQDTLAKDQAAGATPEQLANDQQAINDELLNIQEQALQEAADLSRQAQDAKTTADQQTYQDQRDALKQSLQDKETDLEQAYTDQRDAQKQALQDINDDQRTALQNHLDDLNVSLTNHTIRWQQYLDSLKAMGIDTTGLVNPTGVPVTGAASATRGGVAAGSYYGTLSPFNPTALASGGIVTRPTVALVGEAGREAVIPLDRYSGGIGGARTVEVHLHGGTFIGTNLEQAARELKPALDRVIASTR